MTFLTEKELADNIQTKLLKEKIEKENQNISVNFPDTKINMKQKRTATKCCCLNEQYTSIFQMY